DLRVFDCTVVLRRSGDGPFEVESGRRAYDDGHIPGSAFLDQVDELSDPSSDLRFTALAPEALAHAFGRRGIGAGTRVVLYDRAFNMWATRAWWLLRSIGFDSAAVLDGGWRAWGADGREVSTAPAPVHPPAALVAEPRPGTVVGRAEVEAALADDRVCLVNALSPELHDGTDASYGRPGHIPSSRNVYAVDLVDPDTHRYRPLDELRRVFADAGVEGERIVTWCGGGIAATSDAFVLSLLGHGDVGIYDGSLSDWVAAGLPLEV
ncbi:MAG: rhodanese-like domain-containing protein, partial [Acidimicrobiia bacterium]|nr:rhodanese-like domain-containing protein [Acidimicrobiia bacterium]